METEEKPSWEVYGKYLDIRKVAEWALAREMSVKEALALAGVQNTSETMDRKGQTQIDAIEHALGYPPGGLRRRTKPDTYRVEVRAEVNRRGLAETMKKRGMNMRRLGAAMGHPPETLWSRLCREKNECSIDLPFARKVADALGVGVKSVFSLEIAEAGKKG